MASAGRIAYGDPYTGRLCAEIGQLIAGELADPAPLEERLRELARANSPELARYWHGARDGLGVPDSVFKTNPPYLFPAVEPARVFRTSGTTGSEPGRAAYTPAGLALMDESILAGARLALTAGLDEPAVVRLVPPEQAAPAMVMAHGMELIARRLGHPRLSACVLGPDGFDLPALRRALDAAVAEQRPVVLLGATSVFVNLGEALAEQRLTWTLPPGSRLVDAGGHKVRSRQVSVAGLRALAGRAFGLPPGAHRNLFGMTELASQLYDGCDVAVGPLGERPKAPRPCIRPQVRDPVTMGLRAEGPGLLEVVDLCVLDRPCAVLTGDWGIAGPHGTAITGRAGRGRPRGCSLPLEGLTAWAAT